jgi:hypothetical protein
VKRFVGFAAACWLASVTSAPLHATTDPGASVARHHLEACTKWSERNGSFGAKNECSEPVALLFIQLSGEHRFSGVVLPNERFDTGVSETTITATDWLFTVCPAGYVPSLPFTADNRIAISTGRYECVRK